MHHVYTYIYICICVYDRNTCARRFSVNLHRVQWMTYSCVEIVREFEKEAKGKEGMRIMETLNNARALKNG